MQNTLKDIAAQNALAVNNEITVQFRLLSGFSEELGKEPDNVMDILDEMSKFVQAYDFKRMGYCDADGLTMTTDGYTANLSDRVFFLESMEGNNWVTRTLEDRIGDEKEPINVLSVPVYNEEKTEVVGVLFATYRSEIFQDRLNVDFFEGQGFSCIIKADGDVISHSENSPIADSENFLEHLNSGGENGRTTAEEMKAAMDAGTGGAGRCEAVHGNSEAAIFYYTPLNENINGARWYMVAIAPEDVLTKRMDPVIHQVHILAVAMLVIAVLGVGFFVVVERKRREELSSLAYEDPLTGGYNFASFRENVKIRKGLPGYVVAMDVSEFKLINSFFGVQKGDETLLELWKILLNSVSETEMVARVNADRFVLFLQAEDREQLEKRLQDLIQQIHDISPRLNIPLLFPVFGIYYTEALDEPDKCYGYAVQAKHLVKGRRDRHYAFYDEIDYEQVLADHQLEDSFEEALEQGQFETWYQPKYSAQEEKIIGAEALVRWRKPDGTLISPGTFIPLFEKNGCIAVLDEYIFRRVCEQQKAWLDEGLSVVPVSVNISRVSLYFGDIVERYQEILHSYNLDSQYVQLEITESATVDNAEIANLIERFHSAGFEMLLDDFGSGYSSLASLNTLRFDTLKLDKSLIDYIGDENGEKLLEHITKLGQSLGLHITAEGVETHSQLIFLKNLQCDDIQGYYFSKPLPMDEYQKLM
jgi:EAL domain-containing protein (putative c-di-GMP-specific phosphodiesterase class I)/GGDEF domain-containing protein